MTTCTVCRHERTVEIGAALMEGRSVRAIAADYGLQKSSVFRHLSKCLADQIAQARRDGKQVSGVEILSRLADVTAETRELLQQARDANDVGLALRAIGRLERQLRLEGELVGELDAAGAVHVNIALEVHPQWVELRSSILLALMPYPEARRAVVVAIDTRLVA